MDGNWSSIFLVSSVLSGTVGGRYYATVIRKVILSSATKRNCIWRRRWDVSNVIRYDMRFPFDRISIFFCISADQFNLSKETLSYMEEKRREEKRGEEKSKEEDLFTFNTIRFE